MSDTFDVSINAIHYENLLAIESLSIFGQQALSVSNYLGYTPFPEDGFVLTDRDMLRLREGLGNDAPTVHTPDIHELITFIQFATQSTSPCTVFCRRNYTHAEPEMAAPHHTHGH